MTQRQTVTVYPEKSERHRTWLQFSLGSLLVVVLACSLFFAYTAWWLQQLRRVRLEAGRARQQAEAARRVAEQQLQLAIQVIRATESGNPVVMGSRSAAAGAKDMVIANDRHSR